MAEQHSQTEDYETPFKFNGKELDTETGYYYYGARYYDPKNSIWISVDPLMEKYPNVNPYVYCLQNPVKWIDPTGMSVEPPNDYVFDENGKYVRTDYNNLPHRVLIENKKTGENKYFYLADQADGEEIENNFINNVVFVPESKIMRMLNNQGAFDSDNGDLLTFYERSKGNQEFDYRYSEISTGFKNPSSSLFIVDGDYTAHNFENFGNFLWAATGYALGYDFAELQMGAHFNSLMNSKANGYSSQWDSDDDQRSIIEGAYYAKVKGFRKLVKNQ